MQVKNILIDNCIVQIHKGDSSIWSTPWCSVWKEIHSHLNLPVTLPSLPQNIFDLWTPNTTIRNSHFYDENLNDESETIIEDCFL